MNTLQTRKQLLIIEGEIHRSQLRQCWADLHTSVLHVEETVTKGQSVIRWAGIAMTGFSLFRRLRSGKGSLISRLLTGASIASSLWLAARARSRGS